MAPDRTVLSAQDRETYAWQLDVPGFGEEAQLRLKRSTALISRVGGLGGPVAFHLASAGVGRLILAHAGVLKPGDLNRQILMARGHLGRPRAECARETLQRYKPEIEVEAVGENMSESNTAGLVGRADIVFDCAPLFEERFLMNRECVRQGKPMVDAAMYNLQGQVLVVSPGRTPCLRCLYPEPPPHWKRRFPVLGAVSAWVGAIAALEGIRLLAGLEAASLGHLVLVDGISMRMDKIRVFRDPECPLCGAGKEREA